MRKFLTIFSFIIAGFIIVYVNYFPVEGNYNKSTGVYTNNYFGINFVPGPMLDMSEDFVATKNNDNTVNLFRARNYFFDEQEINDKVDLYATAVKLETSFKEFYTDFLNKESNLIDTKAISSVKKEKLKNVDCVTQEFRNKDWFYKVYFFEKKGYSINITIKYKDIKNKDTYLHNLSFIQFK